MKKQISFSTQGQRVDIGDLTIYRVLPNRYADAVGTFVFLDHLVPAKHSSDKPTREDGTGPHPHKLMKICIPANTGQLIALRQVRKRELNTSFVNDLNVGLIGHDRNRNR